MTPTGLFWIPLPSYPIWYSRETDDPFRGRTQSGDGGYPRGAERPVYFKTKLSIHSLAEGLCEHGLFCGTLHKDSATVPFLIHLYSVGILRLSIASGYAWLVHFWLTRQVSPMSCLAVWLRRYPLRFTHFIVFFVCALRSLYLRVLAYMDDFLVTLSPYGVVAIENHCELSQPIIEDILNRLGLEHHPSEVEWQRSRYIEQLGLVVDSTLMKLFIAPRKVEKVRKIANNLLKDVWFGRWWVIENSLLHFCVVCVFWPRRCPGKDSTLVLYTGIWARNSTGTLMAEIASSIIILKTWGYGVYYLVRSLEGEL